MKHHLIGQKAPPLFVSEWVQGEPLNLDQLEGQVVLVEIFQVNCPGCFMYALPLAAKLHQRYANKGLIVLGLATAFEDFEKNTLENLVRLVEQGEVIGTTLNTLNDHSALKNNRLQYDLTFPIAMDRLHKREVEVDEKELQTFLDQRIPDFSERPVEYQQKVSEQIQTYLNSLDYLAQTFHRYQLQGTPSHILIDKRGIIRDCAFGSHPELERVVIDLLRETEHIEAALNIVE